MKLYSDTLTAEDLHAATRDIAGVTVMEAEPIGRPRIRARGWKVRLESFHNKRPLNSGMYGAVTGTGAATYDEHGRWMAELFAKDPSARIAEYDGADDFHKQTGGAFRAATTKERLEYLRGEIRAERISQGELLELQGLADEIKPGDVELLEWAGVTEEEARAQGRI